MGKTILFVPAPEQRVRWGNRGPGCGHCGGVDASEAVKLNRGITMLDACKSCLALDALPGTHVSSTFHHQLGSVASRESRSRISTSGQVVVHQGLGLCMTSGLWRKRFEAPASSSKQRKVARETTIALDDNNHSVARSTHPSHPTRHFNIITLHAANKMIPTAWTPPPSRPRR